MKNNKIRTITGIGLLVAIEVVLVLLPSIPLGIAKINLGLVPITLAAILFGYLGGGIVGLTNGIMILLDPTTMVFMQESLIGTLVVCLLKGLSAGLVSALVYKILEKKNKLVGTILSSAVTAIVNTTIFILLAYIIYQNLYINGAIENSTNIYIYIIELYAGSNFIIELAISLVLSLAIHRVILALRKE